MPEWTPERKWEGQDAFIIGGGDSLRKFDWNLLRDELTIGCNGNFILGSQICKICIFGDTKFYDAYHDDLSRFGGVVFTNDPHLQRTKDRWLWTMSRKGVGLHKDALGWNAGTGASALNLALILGAKRIFLLGFDMKLSKDRKMNWHDKGLDKANDDICARMLRNFRKYVYPDWKKKFSEVEIINITDDSELDCFPKIGTKEFWNERKKKNEKVIRDFVSV